MDSGRSTGSILLALLDKVDDATQLEVLLEPENLLQLLRINGHSDDQVRAALRTRKPGELLLTLLESNSAQSLLARLPPEARARRGPAANRRPSAAEGSPAISPQPMEADRPFAWEKRVHRLGGWILASSVAPTMLLTGLMPAWRIDTSVGMIVAGLLGVVGGALFAHGKGGSSIGATLRGAVLGALATEGGLLAVEFWTRDRVSVYRVEIALAMVLGGMPAAAVFWVLTRRAQR